MSPAGGRGARDSRRGQRSLRLSAFHDQPDLVEDFRERRELAPRQLLVARLLARGGIVDAMMELRRVVVQVVVLED